jgi:7,8-dihydropterin-6-yl-methyl-4-(beta-D-ribofuranosyl)aminobenzene 5'-phosphate synthase
MAAESGKHAMPDINRRDALKMSAGLAVAAGGFSCIELAKAGPIDVPVIDKLSVRVLVDSASDIFFRPQEVAGVKTEPGRSANSLRTLHSEWGLSLLLEPQRGDDKQTFLLDYGWTPRPSTATWKCSRSIPRRSMR